MNERLADRCVLLTMAIAALLFFTGVIG